MPYNTRRKSLSLPSLGIQLPNASRAHRSPPSKQPADQQSPPSKKIKRSHTSDSESPISPSDVSASSTTAKAVDRPKSRGRAYEHTPPPSPGDTTSVSKIDTEGI